MFSPLTIQDITYVVLCNRLVHPAKKSLRTQCWCGAHSHPEVRRSCWSSSVGLYRGTSFRWWWCSNTDSWQSGRINCSRRPRIPFLCLVVCICDRSALAHIQWSFDISNTARFNWVANWLAYVFDLLRHIFNVQTTIVVVMGKYKFSDSWV